MFGGKKVSRFEVSNVPDGRTKEDGGSCDDDPDLRQFGQLSADGNDDVYVLSLRNMTYEALPRIDLYRNDESVMKANRPSLDDLHDGVQRRKESRQSISKGKMMDAGLGHKKFGWVQGVLILNIMNLWGPMLFLRTSWLVGQGGILEAFTVILFSACITTITALSTSAIATNGEVKGGGTYYMLSRSLGPEYGGAIGLIFAFANMVGVAMNIVGFCESFTNLLNVFNLTIVDGKVNDTRIVGSGVLVLCTIVCLVGMEWVNKLQTILLITLLAAITDVFVGSFLPVTSENRAMGVTGWNSTTAYSNIMPDYRGQTFASIFAVYFPSATGILAGANVSGELKDPQRAIPRGTLLAILITTTSYLLFATIAGGCVIRDASGSVPDLLVHNNYTNCNNGTSCVGGLENAFVMLELVAGFRWLIYAGNFAATISSALACLVGAPRVFQALCRDKIYPGLQIFSKGYGRNDEPIRCYGLTFVVALAVILIGDLNAIAAIMSNFFMAAFCLINFACFHAAVAKSPGFRPSFHLWNKWVSCLGALLCLVVMFVMDWVTAIVTIIICLILYLYLYYKQPEVNWGSSAQAEAYRKALKSVQNLNVVQEHVKNYRPQLLVMTGKPNHRPPLIDFAYQLSKSIGILVCGHVSKPPVSYKQRSELFKSMNSWLLHRKTKVFYNMVVDENFENGTKCLLQLVGVGKLRPNVFLMGYKNNWQNCASHEVLEYFNIIHNAFDMHMGVGIFRMPSGLDFSFFTDSDERDLLKSPFSPIPNCTSVDSGLDIAANSVDGSLLSLSPSRLEVNGIADIAEEKKKKRPMKTNRRKSLAKNIPKDVLDNIDYFRITQRGTIDVWWLYDDGGLTILIPDILSKRKEWDKCELRVFSLANRNNQLAEEQRHMAAMLGKFRIECEHVHILPDITKPAQEATKKEYHELVSKFINHPEEGMAITEEMLIENEERTNRHLRLRELLMEYSKSAALVIITLPMPRRHGIAATLYMSWLEILTKGLPPCLLTRGNQTSVLTFYS